MLPLTDFNCQNLCKFIYKLSEHATSPFMMMSFSPVGPMSVLANLLKKAISLLSMEVVLLSIMASALIRLVKEVFGAGEEEEALLSLI